MSTDVSQSSAAALRSPPAVCPESQPAEEAGAEIPNWCVGCGKRPENLQPIEAVATLRLIQRQSITLARHGQPDGFHATGTHNPPAAAVAATRIAAVLDSADRRLRHLFAEPEISAVGRAGPAGDGHTESLSIPRPSVSEVAERLVRTIASATSEDWYRRRPSQGLSAAEITWLALHQATHYIEDVQQAVALPPVPGREGNENETDRQSSSGRIIRLNPSVPKSASYPSTQWHQDWSDAPHFWGDDAS